MVYTVNIPSDLEELTGISGSFQIIRIGAAALGRYSEECVKRGYTNLQGEQIPAYGLSASCLYLQACVTSVPQQLGADIKEALERMPLEIFEWLSVEASKVNAPLARQTSNGSMTPTSEDVPVRI